MVVITFVRHGETDFNKTGFLQGHLDTPLNQQGREQAETLAERLHKEKDSLPVDAIISSDLIRATETAVIIKQSLSPSLDVTTSKLLRERCLGRLEGMSKLPLKDIVQWETLPEPRLVLCFDRIAQMEEDGLLDHLDIFSNSNGDDRKKIETRDNLLLRARQALNFVMEQVELEVSPRIRESRAGDDGEYEPHVLVVAHGVIIWALLSVLLEGNKSKRLTRKIKFYFNEAKNTAISRARVKKRQMLVDGINSLPYSSTVLFINDATHLASPV